MAKSPEAHYSEQETEARMQAALRGARRIGPKPMSSMTPKRPKKQRKARRALPKRTTGA